MKPLQISAETAQKLSESLNLPLEQIMHMPQHILLAKIAEIQKQDQKVTLDDVPGFFFMSLFHLKAKENTACITLTLDAPV